MKFLPDSAILGTAGRLRHIAKKSARSSSVAKQPDPTVFKARTLDELMELAGIEQTRRKSGK
jgi:hypothetical protein